MREKLTEYVRNLFRYAPKNQQNQELEEEILQNSLDRFDDLVSQGVSPESAYSQAIATIGNVRELWVQEPALQEYAPQKPAPNRRRRWILLGACAVVLVLLVAGIAELVDELNIRGFGRRQDWDDRLEEDLETLVEGIEQNAEQWAEGVENRVENSVAQWTTDLPVSIGTHTISYPQADRYTAGAPELTSTDLERIDIHWMSGEITIRFWSEDRISVEETGAQNDADSLHWLVENNALTIQYCDAGTHETLPSKDLVIQLPQSMMRTLRWLVLDTVSANCTFVGSSDIVVLPDGNPLDVEAVNFNSISGNLELSGVVRSLQADTVSGRVTFTGLADHLELDTVSGDAALTLLDTPGGLSFDSTSAGLSLTIPSNRSFELEFETVSGDLRCAFATQKDDDTWIYTAENRRSPAEFDLETVSGDVEIKEQ